MLYFYLWCVFLLCVILSVPLAAFYEKRKLPPLRPMADNGIGGQEEMGDAFGDDAGGELLEEAPLEPAGDDAFGGGGDDAFGGGDDAFGGGGGDDFPDFDEQIT